MIYKKKNLTMTPTKNTNTLHTWLSLFLSPTRHMKPVCSLSALSSQAKWRCTCEWTLFHCGLFCSRRFFFVSCLSLHNAFISSMASRSPFHSVSTCTFIICVPAAKRLLFLFVLRCLCLSRLLCEIYLPLYQSYNISSTLYIYSHYVPSSVILCNTQLNFLQAIRTK